MREPPGQDEPGADTRVVLDAHALPPRLALSGGWTQADGLPDPQALAERVPAGAELLLSASAVQRWDTSLAAFVRALELAVAERGGRVRAEGLPAGLERLLRLVHAQPASGRAREPSAAERGSDERRSLALRQVLHRALVAAGRPVARFAPRAQAWAELAGRLSGAAVRLATGRARVPWSDVLEQLVECGPRALPIVTLLSFLIGAITAFVGVVQLRMFNAELYVADLVGMGMLLEMGALMTGVIMAGRAGAAFAAALGTMQTNEEVDALSTLGLDPVEFLVLPRVMALTLMTPLLTLYADIVGIAGGGAVAVLMLKMAPATYFTEVASAIHLSDAVKGLIKSVAFGVAIGFAGCLRGIESGRSAQAVGRATTSAVVTSIVLLVLLDAFLTMLYFVYDGQL